MYWNTYRLSYSGHVIFKVAIKKDNEAYPHINGSMKKTSYPRNLRGPFCQLSYYLANKRNLHIHSQGLEIPTLIREKQKIKISHHYHYKKNQPKIPIYMFINYPLVPLKYISIYKYKSIHRFAYISSYIYIVHILATQTINMFYHTYILLYY